MLITELIYFLSWRFWLFHLYVILDLSFHLIYVISDIISYKQTSRAHFLKFKFFWLLNILFGLDRTTVSRLLGQKPQGVYFHKKKQFSLPIPFSKRYKCLRVAAKKMLRVKKMIFRGKSMNFCVKSIKKNEKIKSYTYLWIRNRDNFPKNIYFWFTL